ncbi:hypothetical protein PGT21_005315 [Puccinia graminis f. sp. tritici]|uniref:Uncharacterized protein n=1 Tax=Puccinia graminis f. sp. tritici TaxID=56615 RepID=A0A5B0N223_PUCGR|nr:hypothetical protein PGT21_005315 [Puccinia graminis f. sp. tritici]KAA1133611.1 hypothetical protein PGTUg99_027240 [Puccinia graminis f. sp. tritici]
MSCLQPSGNLDETSRGSLIKTTVPFGSILPSLGAQLDNANQGHAKRGPWNYLWGTVMGTFPSSVITTTVASAVSPRIAKRIDEPLPPLRSKSNGPNSLDFPTLGKR